MVKFKQILSSLLFYLAILFFIIGFQFSDNRAGGWTQQFMPSIGSKQINDITFLDSLTGFAVASRNVNPDTSSILKTTNGGDNWQVMFTQSSRRFSRVSFINSLTGFISGGSGSGTPYLYKTTDGGNNWNTVPGATLGNAYWNDMSLISEDTIWLVDNDGLTGGVFRTTNGGASWEQQLNLGNQNPNHIYMYNGRMGFICEDNVYLRRTTNSGLNWDTVTGTGGFLDMYFVDSLTGWKTSIQKTTNGGLNWVNQTLPQGGNIITSTIRSFSNVNRDTIWGVGGWLQYPNFQSRGMIYRTINGGQNWLFQVPDTAFNIFVFNYTEFVNKHTGWAYSGPRGIHTTNGGNDTFYTSIKQISSKKPEEYRLFQNFPNPFNPSTIIRFQIKSNVKSEKSNVKLVVYNVQGKEVAVLADGEYKTGSYEVTFNGSNYSSGIYFYSLFVDGELIDTKKMILLK